MAYHDHPAFAPIRQLLLDPQVSEIMINGPFRIFVERGGRIEATDLRFESADQLNFLVDRMLKPTGRAVSTASPYVDLCLPDGSRANIIISPIAIDGVTVTIRRALKSFKEVGALIDAGTLSKRMAHLLSAAVVGRLNVLFSGAAGTGKTTTLGILSTYIPTSERIITIEDTAELQLRQQHVVRLECRRANLEGRGEVTMGELVRNALRMRPTRIIIGEIRSSEAVDMLQAILTGHEGCLAVIHASSPVDTISRLEMMSLSHGTGLPLWAVHKQLASAIDLIVQHDMRPDGSRKITYITEVCGVEDDHIILRDLFTYEATGHDAHGHEIGQWICGGGEPVFLKKCANRGVEIPPEVYAAGSDPSVRASAPQQRAVPPPIPPRGQGKPTA